MADAKRYDAFDALRAIMMFLGVVIHSAINYSSSDDMTWPLRARDTSVVFFFLVDFIHAFRMPLFFMLAGFFAALLCINRGPGAMLKNRFKRILLPFVVFIIVLRPFLNFSFKYAAAVFDGQTPVALSEHFSSLSSYIPYHLSHLWFLYYLFIMSVLAYGFSVVTRSISLLPIDNFFKRIFKNPVVRLLTLTAVSFGILFLFGARSFETSVSWIPDFGILCYYMAFYLAGWLLYRNKELVDTLKNRAIVITLFGIMAFCLKFYDEEHMNLISLQMVNSLITCSLSIGITGLFLRFADIPKKAITYFVNSAYWVYLVHLFIAILLAGVLNDLPLSVFLKFLIVLSGTISVCLISYQLFVRKTGIGVFLNGKKT